VHRRVAGQIVAHTAPIAEALHPGKRAADRIGFVPMRRIDAAVEPRFDALDPSIGSARLTQSGEGAGLVGSSRGRLEALRDPLHEAW
jgi:hypothetical protein